MKEGDIRKRNVHNRYLELVRVDAEQISRDKTAFVSIDCPICGGSYYLPQFEKANFVYVQCEGCDTLYVNPRPSYDHLLKVYTDSESTRFWIEEFFGPMVETRRENIFKPRARYVTRKFPELEHGVIGDIGAGFGLFLEELHALWAMARLTAVEPSVEMANICRKKGFSVIESMLEDIDPSEHRFDLLTAFELFEHVHNPAVFLEKIHQLLNPGGYLYLTTLNGLGFDIQLLWSASKSVSPPHHLNFANPHSMTLLLRRLGFTVEEVSTPGELDWDIIEGGYRNEGIDPGRFYRTVCKYGTEEAKRELQAWIRNHNFSSHMRVIARKGTS